MHHARRQRGAALFVGLIFLLVLTILGLTAAKVSTLDERMAGNYLRVEQAYQHAEEAQNDALRFITGCSIDACGAKPTTILPDSQGRPFWTPVAGIGRNPINTFDDEQVVLKSLSSNTGIAGELADQGVISTGPVADHRDATVIYMLDLAGGLMGLEPGSTQRADYYRVTSATRKGDLSGSNGARSTDVIRQTIFVP